MKPSNRQNLFPTIARTSPTLFLILVILNLLINPSYNSLYLFITYIIVVLSNWVMKNAIFKPIYNVLDTNKLKVLGLGGRPEGATSCSVVLDNKPSTSFGMPSGHSQIAWTVAAYLISRIINKWHNTSIGSNKTSNKAIEILSYFWMILSVIIILFCATYISYSRVYIEGCHTLQQVIVGGMIGIVGVYLIFRYENNFVGLF